MSDRPHIDVVIPFYHNPDWVFEAIKSVLDCDGYDSTNVTVHAVSDCSTENWKWMTARFPSGHGVNFYESPERRGPSLNYNAIVRDHCKGEILMMLDADDLCLPRRLEETWAAWPFDLFCGSALQLYPDSRVPFIQHSREFDPDRPLEYHYINPTTAISMERFKELGGFVNCFSTGDNDLQMRFGMADMKAKISPSILILRRLHDDQITKLETLRHVFSTVEGRED